MSSPIFKCPYCRSMFACSGCRTRHVNKKHPDNRREYIDKYVLKKTK